MRLSKMTKARIGWCAAASPLYAIAVLALTCPAWGQTPVQQPPTFRSGVVMVPVDVRVLDRRGNPITNLRASDFTIFEDGVRQEIVHFSVNPFTADPDAEGDEAPVYRQGPGLERVPVTHRTFLIVLSRGRLQGPVKGMDALVDFVRTGLLPQDRIGVAAYGRATDLTRDHGAVVRLLERYRDQHERIEARLVHWFGGLQAVYGSPDIPPGAQRLIDALFDTPGVPPLRTLSIRGLQGHGDFERQRQDALEQIEKLRRRPYLIRARQDFEQLLGAIEYLRYLEGEKHLLLLSDEGLFPARALHDVLAAMAADARVTLSPIHTAGVPLSWNPPTLEAVGGKPPELVGRTPMQIWAMADAQHMARETGGLAALYQDGRLALDRLNRATSFSYLLGYYPTAQSWDGGYRRLRIRVNRPDAGVYFRQGYFAQREPASYDLAQLLADSRIMSAVSAGRRFLDIPVTIAVLDGGLPSVGRPVSVRLRIDASRLSFSQRDGRYTAQLEVALFAADANDGLVGERRVTIDLSLEGDAHERVRQDGITRTLEIVATARPRHVKVVVYERASDRLGSDSTRVR